MAFPTGWTKKCSLTIDNTKVSGTANLSNFPVLLTEANFPSTIFDNTQTTGADLRFTSDESGTTELAFEIVNWDTTNDKAEVWVKIPTVDYDDDTTFYVWYGNATATAYAHTDTYGTHAVWSDYEGVWHLTDNTDSSPNGYDLTATASAPTSTSGLFGSTATSGAYDFETDTPNYFTHSTPTNCIISGSQSFQVWFKPESTQIHRLLNISEASPPNTSIGWTLNNDGGLRPVWQVDGTNGGNTALDPVNIGDTHSYLGTFNSTAGSMAMYKDGSSVWTKSSGASHSAGANSTLGIGKYPYQTWYCDGIIDEVRIREGVLTAGWAATEYANQSAPSTFVTEGEETDVGGGGIGGLISEGFIPTF